MESEKITILHTVKINWLSQMHLQYILLFKTTKILLFFFVVFNEIILVGKKMCLRQPILNCLFQQKILQVQPHLVVK